MVTKPGLRLFRKSRTRLLSHCVRKSPLCFRELQELAWGKRHVSKNSDLTTCAARCLLDARFLLPCPAAGRGNNSALARAWRALTAFFGELPPSIYQGAPPISAAQASRAACVMQPRWLILPRWHAHVSSCGVLGWQTHARRPLIRGILPFECVHLCCVSHAR